MVRWAPSIAAGLILALMTRWNLGPVPRTIGIACVVISFLCALILRRRDVRAHASAVAGIAAMAAAGQVSSGISWIFGILAAFYLLIALSSMRAARLTEPVRTPPWPYAVIGVVTAIVTTIAVFALPPIASRVEKFVSDRYTEDSLQATAFSTHMTLGATTGMLQSDAIVARIDGPPPKYLRGAVYNRHSGSSWWSDVRGRKTLPVMPGGATTLTLDRNAPEGPDMRWFLPPGACGFDRAIEVDGFGVARRDKANEDEPRRIRYSTSGCTPAPIIPPNDFDIEVREELKPKYAAIANEWTAGLTTPKEKIEAIESRLQHYEYSLAVERGGGDPVLDFLTVHKAGHCEFFASALALLARTQGIPTRLVGGYRVYEVNPITGQTIVRDRNAHAWVEVWLDGAWRLRDPTPVGDGPGATRTFFDHLGDLWSLAWDSVRALGPLGGAIVLAALLAALLGFRAMLNWIRRPRRRRAQRSMERPLPCFELLTSKLAEAGYTRDESEPIELFAERIPGNAKAALLGYAAWRYGGIGDESAVIAATELAAKGISPARPGV
jgi:transglutaminase-like putative cysteine protease